MIGFQKYAHWLEEPAKPCILRARDDILITESFSSTSMHTKLPVSQIVLMFVTKLVLAQKIEGITPILTSLFDVPELTTTEEEVQILELIWHSFPTLKRPENTPWPEWTATRIEELKTRFDPGSIEFYTADERQLGDTDWIIKMLSWEYDSAYDPEHDLVKHDIDSSYDLHQWKTCSDPWTISFCARVLLRPEDGKPPARKNIEEAFSAIVKLFKITLPSGEKLARDYFSLRVYFILAIYLGEKERAWELLRMACEKREVPNMSMYQHPVDAAWETAAASQFERFLEVPILYELLAARPEDPLVIIDDTDAKLAQEEWCRALEKRATKGQQEPLSDVPMKELLKRFSEAAYCVYEKDYRGKDVMSPEDILKPPITEEKFAEIEEELGEIPEDVKELAFIADGFQGGWHFAGGGWPGLSHASVQPAGSYEIYLGYFPPPVQSKRRKVGEDGKAFDVIINTFSIETAKSSSTTDFGPVLAAFGSFELCDNFEHVLCPATTWKKIQEAQGKKVKEGEYQYIYYADWTGGSETFSSLRSWIAGMTVELERSVALGERRKEYDNGDEDGDVH